MSENQIVEQVEDVKWITPKELGEEFNLDPKVVRRILRSRFEKKTRTWAWSENDPELQKVRNYIPKRLQDIENEKKKKELIQIKRAERKAQLAAQREAAAQAQQEEPQEATAEN